MRNFVGKAYERENSRTRTVFTRKACWVMQVRCVGPRANYFPVRPSHSVNKHIKWRKRKVDPARRVILPSEKGDPSPFLFCLSSKRFAKFCMEMRKRWLAQGSSGMWVTLLPGQVVSIHRALEFLAPRWMWFRNKERRTTQETVHVQRITLSKLFNILLVFLFPYFRKVLEERTNVFKRHREWFGWSRGDNGPAQK